MRGGGGVPFLLTVDVEPDWGVEGCHAVAETLPRFCALLRKFGVAGTFFVVARLLEECRDLLQEVARGHEIGSHGLSHRRLAEMGEGEVLTELVESRRLLEEGLGTRVSGFRAPFFKTPSRWPEPLAEAGYRYDSSLGCVAPSPRNVRPARWEARRCGEVIEIPPTTMRTGWIPFSLTYLRLLAPLGERLVSDRAAIFYLHLHELADPSLARVLPAPLRVLLRRGAGERAWEMLERLLERVAPRAMTCSGFLDRDRNEESGAV